MTRTRAILLSLILVSMASSYLSTVEEVVAAQQTVTVSLAINYGNGSLPNWFNGTVLSAGSTAFNATLVIAQVDFSVHPQFGVFVNAINGVFNDPSRDLYWALWIYDRAMLAWRYSEVGASGLILQNGDIFMWFYEDHSVFPPPSPGTTISLFLSKSFIAKGQSVTISGSISESAGAPRNITIQFSDDNGATWSELQTVLAVNGTFSLVWAPPATGDFNLRAVSAPFVSNVVTLGVSPCMIATAAFGSPMAAEVQVLRNFRDNKVGQTFLGRNFMNLFHSWYYSFSPTIAARIADSEEVRASFRIFLGPLIAVLRVSEHVFDAISYNVEVAVLTAGVISSAAIGMVYGAPMMLLGSGLARVRRRLVHLSLILGSIFIVSFVGSGLALLVQSDSMAQVFTATIVLSSMGIGALLTAQLAFLLRRHLH